MQRINVDWKRYKTKAESVFEELNGSVELLNDVFGYALAGRKFIDGSLERRFNRVLFEVEAFYFRSIARNKIRPNKQKFLDRFQKLCSDDREFRSSIEATTKTNEQYETRFRLFQEV